MNRREIRKQIREGKQKSFIPEKPRNYKMTVEYLKEHDWLWSEDKKMWVKNKQVNL